MRYSPDTADLTSCGLTVVPLADEAFAIASTSGTLLHLNTTARLIVENALVGQDAATIAAGLASQLHADESVLLADIEGLIGEICQKCRSAEQDLKEAPQTEHVPELPIEQGRYRLFGKLVQINYLNPAIAAVCDPMLAPFRDNRQQPSDLVASFEAIDDTYKVSCGAAEVLVDRTGRAAFSGLIRVLVAHDQADPGLFQVVLHAGSILGDRGAWLIGGVSGHGKSTLVTKLDTLGHTVLGDDLVPVDLERKLAFPYPIALSIKDHGWDTVSVFRPDLMDAEPRVTSIGKHVRHLAPRNPARDEDRQGRTICGLLLPNRTAGASPLIQPLGVKESMLALCDKFGRFPIDPDDLKTLIAVVSDIPRYRLVYDHVDDILPELTPLL